MGNIALNKYATASSYVAPFAPSRCLDGSQAATSRWLCIQLPGSMVVDLVTPIYINRWVVKGMSAAGWPSNYTNQAMKLEVSLDQIAWSQADSFVGNTLATVDRSFAIVKARYVRATIISGLPINPTVGSIVDLEIYDAPFSDNTLTSLTVNTGTITPSFAANVTTYTSKQINSVASVTVTAQKADPKASMTIAGTAVTTNPGSLLVDLNVGSNSVPVVVTSEIGNVPNTYNLTILRGAECKLTNVIIKSQSNTLTTDPAFDSATFNYQVTATSYSAVKITPTSLNTTDVIKVNGTQVASGSASPTITLNSTGTTIVNITVTPADGIETKTYTYTFTK